MRTQRVSEKKQTSTSPKGGLLTFRVLNALPYSNSIKDFYIRTKHSNEALKLGLNLAETTALRVSSPFVKRYTAIDRFAATQLEKIEDRLGVDLVSKSVGAVAYPIGFSLGLAGFARNKVVGLATPAVEMTYEVADAVIDQLLPADYDETIEDEYKKMSSLQQKNPFRRIKERASVNSVARLPSTTFYFTMNMFSSTLYLFTGFASMSMSRMLSSTTNLIDSVNIKFEQDLAHPWKAVSNGDMTKLYKSVVFHGVKSVNAVIDEIERDAQELSEYLSNHNLPYNSQVVKYVASKLKSIERRLVKLGGVQLESTSESVGPYTPRRVVRPYTQAGSTPRRRNTENRTPTMMLGDDQPSWYDHEEHEEREEHAEPEHHEEHISQHKIEVLADRAPTMMWGPTSQKRKAHDQISREQPKQEASKPKEEVSKPKEEDSKPKEEVSKPKEEVSKPKEEVSKPKEVTKPKEATKPRQAKQVRLRHIKKPFRPTKSGYLEAVKKPAPEVLEVKEYTHAPKLEVHYVAQEESVEENKPDVDEHGYTTVKPTSNVQPLSSEVAKDIAKSMLRPRNKNVPVTPVNSPAEVINNNPFGDILVDESDVLRGPELEDAHQAKIRDQEAIAHQRKLHKQTLHELLAEVGCRLEAVERRAEESAEAGPWQSAKHPAHVHVEEPATEPTLDVVRVPENNPFAKLETETTEDPLSMGNPAM